MMILLEDGEQFYYDLAARMKEGVYCHDAHRRGSFVDEKDGQEPEEDEMIKMQYKKTLRRISSLSTFFVEDKIDPNLRVFSDGSSSQTESHQTLEGVTEIEVGQILGSGSFSNVREMRLKGSMNVKDMSPASGSKIQSDLGIMGKASLSCHANVSTASISTGGANSSLHIDSFSQFRKKENMSTSHSSKRVDHSEIKDSSHADDGGDAKYAVKRLKHNLYGESKTSGVIDLAIEAQFLSRLSHPHIVRLHGTGGEQGSVDFFIIVEQIQSTLSDAITSWRRQKERLKVKNICKDGKKITRKIKAVELLTDFDRRVGIARQIALAMQYLHENSILYRDLKPQNIGLDDNGRVKMFDFGLAKELKPQFQVDIDQYKGRMETGSRRYMAPEVYSSDLYGLPADVYSFTVLFWQLLSLQLPFKGLSLEVYAHKVYVKKYRPAVKRNWSKKLKKIIVKGWDHNPSRRPKMNDFLLTLEEYLTFCY